MIKAFEIKNQIGDKVTLIDLGARLISWQTQLNEEAREVVVSYPYVEDFYDDTSAVGAIVGPYANRIKQAQASLNGQLIKLNANEGEHHLHGGKNALDACVWQVLEHTERAITFKYWLEDGFNGYPGAMTFEVEYRLAETSSQLKINFNIVSDKPTIVGPTGHAYFNLSGVESNIDEHTLALNTSSYTPVNAEQIPTGQLYKVGGSDLDFNTPRQINGQVLNHNFVNEDEDENVATLTSPCGALSLSVKSDYPGLQVYTADYLHGSLQPRQGICLEPQYYPDAPNQPNFPFEVTQPGVPFNKKILYKIEKH